MIYEEIFDNYIKIFENELDKYLCSLRHANEHILDCMKYSLNTGGKRIRPILLLATNDMLGGSVEQAMPYAIAVELIHTYSLVHDDLPCMDNDDYRRGKLTSHKKFGENFAVLSGDGLLNLAYEILFDKGNNRNASKILSNFAGISGMIGGQVVDILSEKTTNQTDSDLNYIIENKTGKLLTAPLLIASALNNDKYFNELDNYGKNLGYLFQIIDDILDGKTDKNKFTSVSLYGVEKANELATTYYNNCTKAIVNLPNNDFLMAFTKAMYTRKR